MAVHGEPAAADEAHKEMQDQPPADWPFTKKWQIGYQDDNGSLAALAIVITDLLASGVWHIGLFLLATARHGSGDAQALHQGLQSWALANGAKWLRLGVVQGNTRAERFWESMGYLQTRTRTGMQMGQRSNTLRVMGKPLSGRSIQEYLSRVPRDRPE
jgi:GNAT superfamily N-acetyltransferase